tara:strand:- start:277 stop:534 length:258 start_codon:yes stop_codon:yes gene_type:complete
MTAKDDIHGYVQDVCVDLMAGTDNDEEAIDDITEAFICALATVLRISSRHDPALLAENAHILRGRFTDFIHNVVAEFQPPPPSTH